MPAERLVIFARAPEAGRVKTRLSRALGDAAALAVYRALLEDTCALAGQLAVARELCIAGPVDHPEILRLAAAHDLVVSAQPDGDLGARMDRVLAARLAGAERVCLVGADAPFVTRDDLDAAFLALVDHEAVIGPATDGGYWLIGARQPLPELFSDMRWGTPEVLPETLRRLRGRRAALLQFRYDVDEPADLALARAQLPFVPASLASATRRALAAIPDIC
jgi:rSAM/selenodomain-associated transferase 1